jgi:hypothetical protein
MKRCTLMNVAFVAAFACASACATSLPPDGNPYGPIGVNNLSGLSKVVSIVFAVCVDPNGIER